MGLTVFRAGGVRWAELKVINYGTKGTVDVISRYPPFIDWHVSFTSFS